MDDEKGTKEVLTCSTGFERHRMRLEGQRRKKRQLYGRDGCRSGPLSGRLSSWWGPPEL